MKFPASLTVFFLLVLYPAFPVSPVSAGTVDDVIAEVEKIQNESGMRTASIGFSLVALDGEPDSATGYHMNTGLVPASTMKAITTATANEILKPDFTFTTELQITGAIDESGTLTGNVVVRGGGDPTLGDSGISTTFAKWKTALAAKGIKKIEGSVVGDASIFGTRLIPDSWQWNDIGNYYGAGACGLTFHQNLFYCTFNNKGAGSKASLIGTDPRLPEIQFINEMRVGSAGSGDQGYIYGNPYGKVFYLRGTVPAGSGSFTIKGSLPDPAFFCARAFTKYLNENGVPVSGDPTTLRLMGIEKKELPARETIFEQESDSLGALMILTNHKSNNLRAECFHRMIGLKKKNKGTTLDSSEATRDHWRAKGIDMTGFEMADGCGLSRSNTVTAKQMALILYHSAKDENFSAFSKSMPVAGESGTLRSIGRGTASQGRVRAKSGTLDRVKCYSGYIHSHSGKRYAFAIFVNNYTGSSSSVKSKIVRVWNKVVNL